MRELRSCFREWQIETKGIAHEGWRLLMTAQEIVDAINPWEIDVSEDACNHIVEQINLLLAAERERCAKAIESPSLCMSGTDKCSPSCHAAMAGKIRDLR